MYLDDYVIDLLHINEGTSNKLIDIDAGSRMQTYLLSHEGCSALAEYAVSVIVARTGKTANTVLRGSAPNASREQVIGRSLNTFDWTNALGERDPKQLDSFIDNVYKKLNFKGNNPLFLSVGALKWRIAVSQNEIKDVVSPLLIFPIRLVRSSSVSPVSVEFVDDDAYFNPCLYYRLVQDLGEEFAKAFPHPNGRDANFDFPLDLKVFKEDNGAEYFAQVARFVREAKSAASADTLFEFDKDIVAFTTYDHDEVCMYYDIKRNESKIEKHPLVERVFKEGTREPAKPFGNKWPSLILPADSVQEEIIRRVVEGESMIIKGPPGTGKTLTIANMIGALLGEGKRVMLASRKLSALSEVNAKLPPKLRKFVMLMDYETEEQAAKVNPDNIKRELKALLTERKKHTLGSGVTDDLRSGETEKAEAWNFLGNYAEFMFGKKGVVGGSYYDALNKYFADSTLPAVEFDDKEKAVKVSPEEYSALKRNVEAAGKHFLSLTANGAHGFYKNPWYGVGFAVDAEKAYSLNKAIAARADRLLKAFDGKLAENGGANLDGVSMPSVRWMLRGGGTSPECEGIISAAKDDDARIAPRKKVLKKAVAAYFEAADKVRYDLTFKSVDELFALQEKLLAADLDKEDGFAELERIAANSDVFKGPGGEFLKQTEIDKLLALVDAIDDTDEKIAAHRFEIFKVFSADAVQKNAKRLSDATRALEAYFGAQAVKPKFFDFAAKSAFKKLAPQSYLKGVTFAQTVDAVYNFAEAAKLADERESQLNLIYVFFQKEVEADKIECLSSVLKKCRDKGLDTKRYVSNAVAAKDTLADCRRALASAPEDYTVGDYLASLDAALKSDTLCNALKGFNAVCHVADGIDSTSAPRIAAAVSALWEIAAVGDLKYKPAREVAEFVAAMCDESCAALIDEMAAEERKFAEECFANYYSAFPNLLSLGDWRIFAAEADDRSVLAAMLGYNKILNSTDNVLNLSAFFRPYEQSKISPVQAPFGDTFEHSFYALVAAAVSDRMGTLRNGMGDRVASNLNKYSAAEATIRKANVALIEDRCMQRIDPDDADFGFLTAERESNLTLRKLFKKAPAGIMKLKRCIILSPSTASVLFRPEEYENFDVVIIDEASQLKPVSMIPVLFRAKQCVIVGDEWQMPNIEHFKVKKAVAGDETEAIENSALTVALKNNRFDVEELICHYRSKTESLIAFSQKKFYPKMKTFPSPVPIKEGLGFRDIYVENASTKDGVNITEASVVHKCLKEHFDKYYDDETGVLSQSVGVVAFGESQIKCILSLVEHDSELKDKIDRARAVFDDVPEKLLFFKTIETVQGQETAHLILSLTYGKDAYGDTKQSFGQLNNKELGQCIFNVAVTRAQSSVTVVHSVHAYEIVNDNISFIRDYLSVAEKFGKSGKGQFVSADPGKGFLADVAKFVVSTGISSDRVVLNYGVTDGSVRIPVAILSEDKSCALMGIWCEIPTEKQYNYLDYNIRHFESLEVCGWKLFRLYIQDWYDNRESAEDKIRNELKKYVK